MYISYHPVRKVNGNKEYGKEQRFLKYVFIPSRASIWKKNVIKIQSSVVDGNETQISVDPSLHVFAYLRIFE